MGASLVGVCLADLGVKISHQFMLAIHPCQLNRSDECSPVLDGPLTTVWADQLWIQLALRLMPPPLRLVLCTLPAMGAPCLWIVRADCQVPFELERALKLGATVLTPRIPCALEIAAIPSHEAPVDILQHHRGVLGLQDVRGGGCPGPAL